MPNSVKKDYPVLFYYTPIKKNENDIAYIYTILVLNDKNIGVLLPEQYRAIAEKTNRIEELNNMIIDEVLSILKNNPDKIFIINLSSRFLSEIKLPKILKKLQGREQNFIFAFDIVLLNSIGIKGYEFIKTLRENKIKIMADCIEMCPLKYFFNSDLDILRLDGRFYNNNHIDFLHLLLEYCTIKKIEISVKNVDTIDNKKMFEDMNFNLLQGKAICPPKKNIKNIIKALQNSNGSL
jgi:EAL domain-containing protein (putative c-di-GMP-specific phosphodiesterase class I)